MKTALIQFKAAPNKTLNLKKALTFVQKAAKRKTELIVLPEVFMFKGDLKNSLKRKEISEFLNGNTIQSFQKEAKALKVNIIVGSIHEKVKNTNKVYNTSVVINRTGEVVGCYRKIHLFDANLGKKKIKESDVFLSGRNPVICDINKFKCGMSICYDLRFPSLYQNYAKQGVDMIVVPSAFTKQTGKAHWEVLVRARAIESLSYVLAPNQVGRDSTGVESYGNSMIIDPWGKVIARASDKKEEIIYATLDKRVIKDSRKKLPSLLKNS